MENNKTGKYLKYAVGEIVLVVIGILIALQINNWNETRKQDKAEKEFITSVKNDLKQDNAFIQLIIEGIEPKMEAYEILNSDLPNLYQKERKSLNQYLKFILMVNVRFILFQALINQPYQEINSLLFQIKI